MKGFLSTAKRYRDRYGWSIIPLKGKRPNLRTWTQYKKERPTEKELRDFFDYPATTCLGVICGAISNNLVVRDFDAKAAYTRWAAANPELAKKLPTSRTRRGYHVYFRCPTVNRIRKFSDGELRGNGYVVAPPSPHRGGNYTWIIPPGRKIPSVESPEEAGIIERCVGSPLTAVPAEPTNPLHVSVCVPATVEEAIGNTLPTGPGQRNRCVFDLARALKAMMRDATPDELRDIVKEWHRQALPVIRTKDFTTTWQDFVVAWRRIKGQPVKLAAAVAESQSTPPPPMALRYDDARIQFLVTVCSCLQRRLGERPFFLSVRKAAEIAGVDKNTAARWLQMLEFDGVLKRTKIGTLAGRQASEWQFLGETCGL